MCGLALPLTSLSLNHNQFHLKHRPKTTFHCSGTQLAQEQPTRKHLKITVATRKASRSLLTCPSRNEASYLHFFCQRHNPPPLQKKYSVWEAPSLTHRVLKPQLPWNNVRGLSGVFFYHGPHVGTVKQQTRANCCCASLSSGFWALTMSGI